MKLDERQMDAAFDALTIEAKAERERLSLLQKKKEIANPPFSWRIVSVLAAAIIFSCVWLFAPEMKLFGSVATIIFIVSARWLWRRKVSSQIKVIEVQLNAIRH